jgi:hypothetical protein
VTRSAGAACEESRVADPVYVKYSGNWERRGVGSGLSNRVAAAESRLLRLLTELRLSNSVLRFLSGRASVKPALPCARTAFIRDHRQTQVSYRRCLQLDIFSLEGRTSWAECVLLIEYRPISESGVFRQLNADLLSTLRVRLFDFINQAR